MDLKKNNILDRLTGNFIIKGTIILTVTGIITRIIGFYNRIFLSDLIGSKELGIYQLVLPLYILAFAICTYGNELALTKLISEYKNENERNVFFRFCILISFTSSIIISILLYTNADYISLQILNAPACAGCIKILCYAIPSIALKGCIHGYFLGLKNPAVHGLSDLIEQITKVLSVFILATFFYQLSSYDAEFAVWGIVFGEYFSLIYSIFQYVKLQTAKSTCKKINTCDTCSSKKLKKVFLKTSIPMTVNRFAITLIQSIESILIPSVLLSYYKDSNVSLSIYGVIMGISFPFIMFPATITNSLSSMLMPAVSSANSENNKSYMTKIVEYSIHFCLLIGLFASVFFFIFGKEIGLYFFHNKHAGIYLYQLSFLCPLIYLSTTFASIINGLGLVTRNLVQTIISTLIRILFIIFLIPKIGIIGYIIGLFVSYFFLSYASSYRLNQMIDFHISVAKSILFPALFFFFSGYLYYFAYKKSITMLPIPYGNIIMLLLFMSLYCITTILPFIVTTYKGLKQHR